MSQRDKGLSRGFQCAVERARRSSGRKVFHPATVAPAGSSRSVADRQRSDTKPPMPKVPQGGISEHIAPNESEHRASLETGNVDAESVETRRRPQSGREASNKSTG